MVGTGKSILLYFMDLIELVFKPFNKLKSSFFFHKKDLKSKNEKDEFPPFNINIKYMKNQSWDKIFPL